MIVLFQGLNKLVLSLFISFLYHYNGCTAVNVTLTVEGGDNLVGSHCPGTVRLLCEGVGLYRLGWTYNNGSKVIDRIEPDNAKMSFKPANPAFVSVTVSITKTGNESLTANFSSVLTVNLLELSKQGIQNISCGDIFISDALEIDYFTPNVTAFYQVGVLNKIEVKWKLPCPDYMSSFKYKINLTNHKLIELSPKNCVNITCDVTISAFLTNTYTQYDLTVQETTNDTLILSEFKMTIAHFSKNYFIWNVTSTICQLYTIQFAAVPNISNKMLSSIQHLTNHDTQRNKNFSSSPLKSQFNVSYINPGTVHYFILSAMIKDSFHIMDSIITVEPSIVDFKGVAILLVTSLFLCLGLIHLFILLLSVLCKPSTLSTKKESYTISTMILLVLMLSCVALLIAFGIIIKGDGVCYSSELIPTSLLDVMIVVSLLGIILVAATWLFMGYGFCKHRKSCHSMKQHITNNNSEKATTAPNCSYNFSHSVSKLDSRSKHFNSAKSHEQINYDTLEHSDHEQLYLYAKLNKETMLPNPNKADQYMPLRARERSKPVPDLIDSYSYIGRTTPGPTTPHAENYDIQEISEPITRKSDKNYHEVDISFEQGDSEVYTHLRQGEKTEPIFDDTCYSYIQYDKEEAEDS